MAPTVAQKLKGRCGERIKTRHHQGRLGARAASPSDDKTSNTTGNGISATRRSGRAIGRLGRQDAGHGTTRSTARTDWVGNGCQGTFPFPQLERQDRGRLGQDEHGAGHLRIKVHDLSGTAWPVRRNEDLGRPQRTTIDDRPAHRSVPGRDKGLTGKGPGLPAGAPGSRSVTSRRQLGYGVSRPARQPGWQTLRQEDGCTASKRRAVKVSRIGPADFLSLSRLQGRCGGRIKIRHHQGRLGARAARRSDGKTDNTAGKGISATRRSVRTERRLRRQDAGRRTIRSTARTDGVGHISSSRLEQEDGGRLGQDEHGAGHLRVRTPGSTSVTSQRRLGWADVMRTVSADEYRCMRVQSDQLTFRPFLSSKDRQAQGPDGLRARATRNSDGKTIITVGKSSSATRQVRAAKGTVRRSKRGTTQCTARTVGVGKSRQDTFPPRAAGAARRRTTRSRRARSRSSKGPDARINVRDLSETAWALRCDKALVRPGGRVDDRCMARAARRCARIKVRDLSETAWKTVRETTEGTVAQDPHENGNDSHRRWGKRTDVRN
ncbi:hypothetical protein CF319_g8367 [Tilletia indica]|nr:hypothetical protein CF319_g8367 [Tilletia indica]